MSLYATGTITGALNATTISGTGTKWSDAKIGITNGSVLFVSSNAGVDGVYQVKRVISDTSIELAQPIYKTFTNSKYSILVAESASTAAWSNQLAATLGYYQAQMDGWQQIMTGTGDIALTAPDGTKVTIKSFTKMSQDIDKKQDKSDILTDLSRSKDADGVREYLGLNESLNLASDNAQIVTSASGILSFFNYLKNTVKNSTGTLLSKARIYSEIRNDSIGYSTLETSANGKISYLSHSENGDLSTAGVITGKEIRARGGNYGGLVVGTYGGGNNRDITLNTAEGDPSIGAWVNLVQGNYGSNAFWQLGGVKNAVGVLDNFQFGLSNGVDLWRSFNFFPQYGGYLSSAKYKAAGVRTGWGGDGAYMESPFWVDNVVNNDDSWVPFIRGATSSTGGYATSASYGLISQGNANWPQAAIKLFGDGLYHRGFQFSVNGDISTWGDSVWGGNFIFTKSPNSDRDLKKSIEYNDGKSSYDRVMQYKPTTFVYKADKRERVRRGFIAQDLMQIDPEYVHLVPAAPVYDEEDKRDIENQKDDTLALDSNVLLLDGLQALRYMGDIIENQKNALAALEEKITTMAGQLAELKKSKS